MSQTCENLSVHLCHKQCSALVQKSSVLRGQPAPTLLGQGLLHPYPCDSSQHCPLSTGNRLSCFSTPRAQDWALRRHCCPVPVPAPHWDGHWGRRRSPLVSHCSPSLFYCSVLQRGFTSVSPEGNTAGSNFADSLRTAYGSVFLQKSFF